MSIEVGGPDIGFGVGSESVVEFLDTVDYASDNAAFVGMKAKFAIPDDGISKLAYTVLGENRIADVTYASGAPTGSSLTPPPLPSSVLNLDEGHHYANGTSSWTVIDATDTTSVVKFLSIVNFDTEALALSGMQTAFSIPDGPTTLAYTVLRDNRISKVTYTAGVGSVDSPVTPIPDSVFNVNDGTAYLNVTDPLPPNFQDWVIVSGLFTRSDVHSVFESGNRISIITVTKDPAFTNFAGTLPEHLVNGLTGSNATAAWAFGNAIAVFNKFIQYEFNVPVRLETFRQAKSDLTDVGTWKIQASLDGVIWVDVSPTVAWIPIVTEWPITVTEAFPFYRMLGQGGNSSTTPFLPETVFTLTPKFKYTSDDSDVFLGSIDNPLLEDEAANKRYVDEGDFFTKVEAIPDNSAFDSGDRISIITVTKDPAFTNFAGTLPEHLVNGLIGGNAIDAWAFGNSIAVLDKFIQYEFNTPVRLQKLIQDKSNTVNVGTWKIQSSADGVIWVDVSSAVAWAPLFTTWDITVTEPFKFYRMLGTAGNSSTSPWLPETTFVTEPETPVKYIAKDADVIIEGVAAPREANQVVNKAALEEALPFNPSQIAGLSLWLDADDPSTIDATANKLMEWRCKSANGNDFSTPNPGNEPSTGIDKLNGRNVISFDGVGDFTHADEDTMTMQTIFIVAEVDPGFPDLAGVFTQRAVSSENIRIEASSQRFLGNATESPLPTVDDFTFGGSMRIDGALGERVELNQPFVLTAISPTAKTFTPQISQGLLGRFWKGKVAEIFAYDRLLTTAEMEDLEGYAKRKWIEAGLFTKAVGFPLAIAPEIADDLATLGQKVNGEYDASAGPIFDLGWFHGSTVTRDTFERGHAAIATSFTTGSDITTDQNVLEFLVNTDGVNLIIRNGQLELYSTLDAGGNVANADWIQAIEPNTTYTVVILHNNGKGVALADAVETIHFSKGDFFLTTDAFNTPAVVDVSVRGWWGGDTSALGTFNSSSVSDIVGDFLGTNLRLKIWAAGGRSAFNVEPTTGSLIGTGSDFSNFLIEDITLAAGVKYTSRDEDVFLGSIREPLLDDEAVNLKFLKDNTVSLDQAVSITKAAIPPALFDISPFNFNQQPLIAHTGNKKIIMASPVVGTEFFQNGNLLFVTSDSIKHFEVSAGTVNAGDVFCTQNLTHHPFHAVYQGGTDFGIQPLINPSITAFSFARNLTRNGGGSAGFVVVADKPDTIDVFDTTISTTVPANTVEFDGSTAVFLPIGFINRTFLIKARNGAKLSGISRGDAGFDTIPIKQGSTEILGSGAGITLLLNHTDTTVNFNLKTQSGDQVGALTPFQFLDISNFGADTLGGAGRTAAKVFRVQADGLVSAISVGDGQGSGAVDAAFGLELGTFFISPPNTEDSSNPEWTAFGDGPGEIKWFGPDDTLIETIQVAETGNGIFAAVSTQGTTTIEGTYMITTVPVGVVFQWDGEDGANDGDETLAQPSNNPFNHDLRGMKAINMEDPVDEKDGVNKRTLDAVLPFNPTQLTGLSLWLDASDVNTITEALGAVSAWNDKSGNGVDFAQASAPAQPETGVDKINSRNVLGFDGTNQFMPASTSITAGTIFIIAELDPGFVDLAGLFNEAGANDENIKMDAAFQRFFGNPVFPPIPSSEDFTFDGSMRIDGAVEERVELNQPFVLTALALAPGAFIPQVSQDFSSRFWKGKIAEVIVYDRILTADEINQVEEYATQKWILPEEQSLFELLPPSPTYQIEGVRNIAVETFDLGNDSSSIYEVEFTTGVDITTTQVILALGDDAPGVSFFIQNELLAMRFADDSNPIFRDAIFVEANKFYRMVFELLDVGGGNIRVNAYRTEDGSRPRAVNQVLTFILAASPLFFNNADQRGFLDTFGPSFTIVSGAAPFLGTGGKLNIFGDTTLAQYEAVPLGPDRVAIKDDPKILDNVSDPLKDQQAATKKYSDDKNIVQSDILLVDEVSTLLTENTTFGFNVTGSYRGIQNLLWDHTINTNLSLFEDGKVAFAFSFETGADVTTYQQIFDGGSGASGTSIFFENGILEGWFDTLVLGLGFNVAVEANTRYTLLYFHEGFSPTVANVTICFDKAVGDTPYALPSIPTQIFNGTVIPFWAGTESALGQINVSALNGQAPPGTFLGPDISMRVWAFDDTRGVGSQIGTGPNGSFKLADISTIYKNFKTEEGATYSRAPTAGIEVANKDFVESFEGLVWNFLTENGNDGSPIKIAAGTSVFFDSAGVSSFYGDEDAASFGDALLLFVAGDGAQDVNAVPESRVFGYASFRDDSMQDADGGPHILGAGAFKFGDGTRAAELINTTGNVNLSLVTRQGDSIFGQNSLVLRRALGANEAGATGATEELIAGIFADNTSARDMWLVAGRIIFKNAKRLRHSDQLV